MDNKILIIAEAGVNHNGSLERAFKLVDCALEARADIVKFQTFISNSVVSKKLKMADYQTKNLNNNSSQYEMIKGLELSFEEHLKIKEYCNEKKIQYLSTPFDFESLNFLVNEAKINLLKIPSGEITNYPFLLKIAQTKLPLILSTGMSTLADVETALSVIAFGLLDKKELLSETSFKKVFYTEEAQNILKKYVTLLHCTTEYPAPFNEVNLKIMNTLTHAFELNVGYSDHSEGISIPIAAAALGAKVIEKHFTLDKNLPGPDHKASLDPLELKSMVKSIREVEQAIGSGRKIPTKSELKNINIARKILVASQNIEKDEYFTEKNICMKRAGDGLSPMKYWDLIGKKSHETYYEDDPIKQ